MIVTLIRPTSPGSPWLLAPEDGSEPEQLQLQLNEFLTLEMVMGGSDRVRVHARRAGVLGAVGAFVGGFLFHLIGHSGVSGINIYSIFVAAIGAVVVLVVWHALVGRRRV